MAKRTITPELRSAQEKSFPSRLLKVRKSFYDHQLLQDNRVGPYKRAIPVPWIQMRGYWLDRAGFAIGTLFSVEVRFGCMVLRVIHKDSASKSTLAR